VGRRGARRRGALRRRTGASSAPRRSAAGRSSSLFPTAASSAWTDEAARFDDRFVEVSRTVLPLEEGSDAEAATRVVEQLRRLERLGARASGADWAELALLPGAPAGSHVTLARRDPDGALTRLARVPDGDAATPLAAQAVGQLVDLVETEERPAFRRSLRALAEEGGPVWLRRAAAFVLLAGPGEAPAWALPTVAEAVAAGTAGDAYELPDEAWTVELAELVTAVDRARIDRNAAERPELAEALLAGSLDDAFSSSFEELASTLRRASSPGRSSTAPPGRPRSRGCSR
jgi:hypothetical protein